MKVFACPACGAVAYFDNLTCVCGQELCFDPDAQAMVAADGPCANRGLVDCNWRAPEGGLCAACAMTAVSPGAASPEAAAHWREAERAKRWVLAALGRWGWFGADDAGPRPIFHLLSERLAPEGRVTMGHENGVVTINITEADPVEEVRRRETLGEPYRTMIGHFRHELAHFLFERLGADPDFAPAFAALFGDVGADYGAALERHYNAGPPPDWPARHVTAYASAHPHEDWAESVAHLMHLADIADSAAAVGLAREAGDAYAAADAEAVVSAGVAIGLALNHVNRSMGLDDIYPFVLSDCAREKLAFAHRWLRRSGGEIAASGVAHATNVAIIR